MKKILMLTILIGIFAALAVPVQAVEEEAGAAGTLPVSVPMEQRDPRVGQLRRVFEAYGSPFATDAQHFVHEADRLGLDWKLVAAISGVESVFGKRIPAYSYNAWGWAVYTGMQDGRHFADWKEGITTVSEGLKYNYVDRGAVTVEQIGHIYAADPHWAGKVRFFIHKIDSFTVADASELPVTL